MHDPDPTFADEVDAYISDGSTQDDVDAPHPSPSHPQTPTQPDVDSEIDLDRLRLSRFRNEAMSYLTRAYAEGATESDRVELDKRRLEAFHTQAVSFLERAYANEPGTLVTEEDVSVGDTQRDMEMLQRFHHQAMSFLGDASSPKGEDRSGVRIQRDMARLEQHYQDAMSFLNRADAGGGLIVEQELEIATVERFQLQKYAREAMSFLDKAFREDASVMVEDEELSPNKQEAEQIAADRAALERYDEEFGQFLESAYLDDSNVIVEDAESETSGRDRGLYARRMAESTTSAETEYSGATMEDDFSEDAHTDEEFQDLDNKRRVLEGKIREGHETIRRRMAQYEREAADYLDGTNVSEEESEREDVRLLPKRQRAHQVDQGEGFEEEEDQFGADRVVDEERQLLPGEIDQSEDDQFGADLEVEEEQRLSLLEVRGQSKNDSSSSDFETPALRFPDRVDGHRSSPALVRDSQDLLVDVVLEDRAGKSREWSDVPLERSFYRSVPRGSTIKLRPRFSADLSASSTTEPGCVDSIATVPVSELQRVEKERDALMATLEEIVNERSMLAAQVSEMKTMIVGAGGGKKGKQGDDDEFEIDLAAELRDAHETMEKLTEEMEVTLSVLDSRYQDALKRAHAAEERCIRLESDASKLQADFSTQGMRLSQAMSEERRLVAIVTKTEREFEALRNKSESDIQRIDESYRDESDRNVRKIRELQTEIATLQKERSETTVGRADRKVTPSPTRRLELEVSSLKRKLGESERQLQEERISGRKRIDSEVEKVKSIHAAEIRELTTRLEGVEINAKEAETLRTGLRKEKSENQNLNDKLAQLDTKVVDLLTELKETRGEQLAAEAEAREVRNRYEESLKNRISELDSNHELADIQSALQTLRDESTSRERSLRIQLAEFKQRAEEAQRAATSAEKDAVEAAEVAKVAQERGRLAVDAERKARQAAEAETQAVVMESRAWEKFAQEQMEKGAAAAGAVVKSSSRRGLRRSPPSTKKKADKKADKRGEESGRKKTSHLPRLFGS